MNKSRMELIGTVMLGVAVAGVALWFLLEPRPERRHADSYQLWDDVPARVEEPEVSAIAETAVVPSAIDTPIETAPFEASEPDVPASADQQISVVDGESGAPVPYAAVYRLDPDEFDPDLIPRTRSPDPVALLREYGKRYDCDSRGRAWVPKPSPRTALCAVQGLATGFWIPRPGVPEGVIQIAISRPMGIPVRVVDAAGRPCADVPVALALRHDPIPPRLLSQAVAGAEGSASIAVSALALSAIAGAADGEAAWVVALVLAEPEVGSEVALDPLPAEPVELVVPAMGAVRVRVRDPSGRPYDAEPLMVALQRETPPGTIGPSWDRLRPAPQAIAGGEALFPWVGLGLRVEAVVRATRDSGLAPITLVGDGPRVAGEEVLLEGTIGEYLPVVVGRLVDVNGRPWTSGKIECQVHSRSLDGGWRSRGTANARITRDGRFRVVLEAAAPRDGATRELTFMPRDQPEGAPLEGHADLSRTLPPGETDLGDLIVGPEAIVVSGLVLDTAGEPVDGVAIGITAERPPPFAGAEPQWESLGFSEALAVRPSDAQGRFAVYGKIADHVVRVTPMKVGYWADPVEVACGTEDLRLVLDRAGRFRARIKVEGDTPRKGLYAGLRIQSPDDTGWGGSGLPEDGVVSYETLRPGTYRFMITSSVVSGIVHEVRDIVIVGGKEVDLGEIAIRIEVRNIAVEVVDREGRPLPSARVQAFAPGEDVRSVARAQVRGGRATLTCRPGPVDLTVSSRGYRTARLERVGDQARVVLEPGLEVILVLQNLEALPPDPCKLVVSGPATSGLSGLPGSLGSPRSRGPGGGSAPPTPPGEFRLSLGRPGQHTVAFMVQRGDRSEGGFGLSATFQVEDRPGVQRVPIRLDAARVAQLVKKLTE